MFMGRLGVALLTLGDAGLFALAARTDGCNDLSTPLDVAMLRSWEDTQAAERSRAT